MCIRWPDSNIGVIFPSLTHWTGPFARTNPQHIFLDLRDVSQISNWRKEWSFLLMKHTLSAIQWRDFGKNWVWQKQPEASNMFFYSICIRGSFSNLCVHTGISQSPYAYRDCWHCNPRMHMGNSSLYAYGEDLGNPRMHTPGTGQSLTICIWNPFPYGKSKLGSQSANFTIRGLP